MYFGLYNPPATFQTMSDMADVMVIYIDDLMIYTKTNDIQEHERCYSSRAIPGLFIHLLPFLHSPSPLFSLC
jgi:hypothetical protein